MRWHFFYRWFNRFSEVAPEKKAGVLVCTDIFFVWASHVITSVLLGFKYIASPTLLVLSFIMTCVWLGMLMSWKLYSSSWRFASTREFKRIYGASLYSFIVFCFLSSGFVLFGSVDPVLLVKFVWLHSFFVFFGVFSSRACIRAIRDEICINQRKLSNSDRVLIVGAGSAGVSILREMVMSPKSHFEVVGFVDDSPSKRGKLIQNVLVLGDILMLKDLINQYSVSKVIVAMPSVKGDVIRRIIQQHKVDGVSFKTTPHLSDLVDGTVSVEQLRDVKIEDILGRDEVSNMIMDEENNYVKDKVVLVTGGGGSIGSELCVQILKFKPKKLIVFDNCEDHVYQIERKIYAQFPQFNSLICRVSDAACLEDVRAVFQDFVIDVVFHAAAYKHVPLMQVNRAALIKNNIKGTHYILDASKEASVDRFILISTDKAVNPTNEMGASKRFCELLTIAYANEFNCNFCVVRFGNVLGSRGSVIPLFREQIKSGGPVTVTHPDITRFFMTIPEASRLVLQAGLLAAKGSVFTLDMGEPIKIIDLAKDMIRLSNLSENNIDIEFTGLRPGEKMYEELSYNTQQMQSTAHAKIFVETETCQFDLTHLLLSISLLEKKQQEHILDVIKIPA